MSRARGVWAGCLRGDALGRRRRRARFRKWASGFANGRTGGLARLGCTPQKRGMQASAALGGPARWAQRLTGVTILGVGRGITGPFGSYLNDGPLMRVAYWTGMLWAGAIGLGL